MGIFAMKNDIKRKLVKQAREAAFTDEVRYEEQPMQIKPMRQRRAMEYPQPKKPSRMAQRIVRNFKK